MIREGAGYLRPGKTLMKLTGLLRNGQVSGYPLVESIRSIVPIADEFPIELEAVR